MTKEIQLTKGLVTLVDDEDFEWLVNHSWYASGNPRNAYAARRAKDYENLNRKLIFMHREILEVHLVVTPFNHVDHINGETLDNRKVNLRLVTQAENLQNSTTAKNQTGIGYDATHDRFKAYVNIPSRYGTKRINVGTYKTKTEAVSARNEFLETLK